ncbi:hypothetical protein [Leptospira barantonii]|uniref:Lipoprotein n=1 Tax=Leptospira barantonii TaxID=2023184 RepID=A0ABX4NM81_9LEPT|nr:hypothetical protein [Leptospira barantonii]PJZ57848.1 hypothetical protein CH367_05465 [Leptospira barantonii]
MKVVFLFCRSAVICIAIGILIVGCFFDLKKPKSDSSAVAEASTSIAVQPRKEKHRCGYGIDPLKSSGLSAKENKNPKVIEEDKKKILEFMKKEWSTAEKILPVDQFIKYDISIVDGFYCATADKKLKSDANNVSLQCGIEYVFKSDPFTYLSVQIFTPQCPPES